MNRQTGNVIFISTALIFIFGMYLPARKPNLFPSYGKNHEARLKNISNDKHNAENHKTAGNSNESKNSSNAPSKDVNHQTKDVENNNLNSNNKSADNSDGTNEKDNSNQAENSNNSKCADSNSGKYDLTRNIKEDDIILGDENAPITFIEYSSYTCPHCSEFHKHAFDTIKRNYIDKGLMKYVLREFPSDYQAFDAAVLARCANIEDFYNFADILYKRQDNWAFRKNYRQVLSEIGSIGGVNNKEFQRCLNDQELKSKILQNRKEADLRLNLQGTPVFFINGKKVEGAAPYKYMKESIDIELKAMNYPINDSK
jgi:protein-disulfide isomerase